MTSSRTLMICLDIDGTLLQYDGTLHDVTRNAVRACVEAGHHVVLATGRAVVAVVPIIEMLGLRRGFVVCSNGAITLRLDSSLPGGYEIIDRVTFDATPALELLRGQWEDAVVAVEEDGVFKVTALFPDGELEGQQIVVPWEELMAKPVTRVTFRSPTGTSDDFLEMAERIGLHEVNYTVGFTAWMDINPEGVSKASALELVRRKLTVEPRDTVAIGDQRNDIEMLEWAARGVAMGQAPDEVKAAADEVTAPIEDDGAALVLQKLGAGIPARLSVITLGARSLPKLRQFYTSLGWREWAGSDDNWAAYVLGGVALALFPVSDLAAEAAPSEKLSEGFAGVTLACNVDAPHDVDTAFAAALAAGATAISPPQTRAWGGRSAYFADPEGNRWEIAHAEGARFDERGALIQFGE